MVGKFDKHTDQLLVKFEVCLDQQAFDLLNVCMRFGIEQIFGEALRFHVLLGSCNLNFVLV